MADNEVAPKDVMSLAWSAASVVGGSERAKSLQESLSTDNYDAVRKIAQAPGRTRAIIAIALSKELLSCDEFLERVKGAESGDEWEEAVIASLSSEGIVRGAFKEALESLNKLTVGSQAASVNRIDDKYLEESANTEQPAPTRPPEFTPRSDFRKSDLLRVQISTSRPSPALPIRQSPLLNKPPQRSDRLQRKPSLPGPGGVRTPGSYPAARAHGSLPRLNQGATRKKMVLEENDTTVDPDSHAAVMMRDEQKKREREQKKKEAEERKRQREKEKQKQRKGKGSGALDDDSNEDGNESDENGATLKRRRSELSNASSRTDELPSLKSKRSLSRTSSGEPEKQVQDVDQLIGPNQNCLSPEDREEITHFLRSTKNVFQDGQETRSFIIHQTRKESAKPDVDYVVESIILEISQQGQWKKLRRTKSVPKQNV
mmetsp:Transcript_11121/g.34091  ORF Transcript_11121/g.34091 Transcript_11121/m.34091 type:complete len:430 (+) Transcript_11121:363-1652(+)